jgi:hypothetical protein
MDVNYGSYPGPEQSQYGMSAAYGVPYPPPIPPSGYPGKDSYICVYTISFWRFSNRLQSIYEYGTFYLQKVKHRAGNRKIGLFK